VKYNSIILCGHVVGVLPGWNNWWHSRSCHSRLCSACQSQQHSRFTFHL